LLQALNSLTRNLITSM